MFASIQHHQESLLDGWHIAIVEDDKVMGPMMRQLVSRHFTNSTVEFYPNVETFLEGPVLKKIQDYHMIIFDNDLGHPDIEGHHLAETARKISLAAGIHLWIINSSSEGTSSPWSRAEVSGRKVYDFHLNLKIQILALRNFILSQSLQPQSDRESSPLPQPPNDHLSPPPEFSPLGSFSPLEPTPSPAPQITLVPSTDLSSSLSLSPSLSPMMRRPLSARISPTPLRAHSSASAGSLSPLRTPLPNPTIPESSTEKTSCFPLCHFFGKLFSRERKITPSC